MAKYINRADVIASPLSAHTVRNYLVISKEASTPQLLQVAINDLLVNGPDNINPEAGIHLMDIQYLTNGTGGNTKYIAFLSFYFTGFDMTTQFQP